MLPQSAQCERSPVEAGEEENGIGRVVREVLGEEGWEERSVWE